MGLEIRRERGYSFQMRAIPLIVLSAFATACASGITNVQKQELNSLRAKGYYVEEKSVGTSAAMGILPGGGSFYTRNYGLGIVNLLFWPISVLWDPVSGTNGAESLNYSATKANVEKLRRNELRELDEKLAASQIDNPGYVRAKNEIDRKYEP
jgi:hypothetical protein